MAHPINNKEELQLLDQGRDRTICGQSLAEHSSTRYSSEGAHDPTATYYFILEDLFSQVEFDASSHLLDVGCGAGRALAYFADAAIPGRATGVELDPALAARCAAWTRAFPQLSVVEGSVLELPLGDFTHFYLFNPFDSRILVQFLDKLEREVAGAITLIHMSDNGENYYYYGRPGWTQLRDGNFHTHDGVPVYGHPQHFTIWRYQRP